MHVPAQVRCGLEYARPIGDGLSSVSPIVALAGAPANTPATLLLGFTSAALPLVSIGMPGCFLNVAQVPFNFNVTTSATGAGAHMLGLPNLPLDVYFQWAFLKPGANALGILATPGLKVQSR